MNSTGKAARKRVGNRYAAKRAKARRKGARKTFGKLPVSQSKGNAQSFVLSHSGVVVEEPESSGGLPYRGGVL